MTNIYKYSFYIFLILVLALLNYFRIDKANIESERAFNKNINNKRINTILSFYENKNKYITNIGGIYLLDKKYEKYILKDTSYLIILVAYTGCDGCQRSELNRISRLNYRFVKKNIKVIVVTSPKNIILMDKQMEILKESIPVYIIDESIFQKEISFGTEYPQILYVKNNVILSAFKPIPGDNELSERFYGRILSQEGM